MCFVPTAGHPTSRGDNKAVLNCTWLNGTQITTTAHKYNRQHKPHSIVQYYKNKMVKPIVTILCAPEQNRHRQEQRAVILCTVTGEHKDNSQHTKRDRERGTQRQQSTYRERQREGNTKTSPPPKKPHPTQIGLPLWAHANRSKDRKANITVIVYML